jgi:SAM-dependent methyltransferase
VTDSRDFFAARAATWDDRFPDDGPRYEHAVAELQPRPGGVALDIGCGTGRALPYLRAAVGPRGTVVGLDLTVQMLGEARARKRDATPGGLVRADAARLPVLTGSCDSLFAAGLLHHLRDPIAGLREFARVSRPGARLALFHPIGRAALAARHGGVPAADDIRGEARIAGAFASTGWRVQLVDDSTERYLALAVRESDPAPY